MPTYILSRSVPCYAPHELLPWLADHGLAGSETAADEFWSRVKGTHLEKHPAARTKDKPLYLYGDGAEYTKYADHILGVYIGTWVRQST